MFYQYCFFPIVSMPPPRQVPIIIKQTIILPFVMAFNDITILFQERKSICLSLHAGTEFCFLKHTL